MKIGIFGGTFNPPHKAHLRLAEDFAKKLNLEKVLIIPDKTPVHKSCEGLESNENRLRMCELNFKSELFEVSRIEIDRETDSYTVYTLRQLKKMYPNDEFYLIIGSDMFLMFDKWYEYEEILKLCTVCVASRSDAQSIDTLCEYCGSVLGRKPVNLQADKIIISPIEPFEASSSLVREMLKNGENTDGYLSADVRKFIEDRELYGYSKK